MKDEKGKCKHTKWQYENDEPEFVCKVWAGYYCYGDENCPRYEKEENNEHIFRSCGRCSV